MASLGLLASTYGSSSESESDDEDSTNTNNSEAETVMNGKEKLPSPFLLGGNSASNDGLAISGSVFSNPFLEAEKQQTSVLEKHVKMTTPSNKVSALNGRQICWNYRKGRCRFGHNCKFAHDSDVPLGNKSILSDDDSAMQKTTVIISQQTHPREGLNEDGDNGEEVSETVLRKRKKRAGLAQGLIPPKKALKAYFGQQATKFIINK